MEGKPIKALMHKLLRSESEKNVDVKYHVIVSLGRYCNVTYYLKQLKLRKQLFPFDALWQYNDFSVVNRLIRNDFFKFVENLEYVDVNTAKLYEDRPFMSRYNWIKNNNYSNSFYFIHYDPIKNVDHKKIMLRRVKRFKKLLNSKYNVLFIRVQNVNEDTFRPPGSADLPIRELNELGAALL